MATYVMVHKATGDEVRVYTSQDQATVTTILQTEGVIFDFMTQRDYAGYIGTPQILIKSIAEDRADAIDSLVNDRHGMAKFIRAVLLTIFDENNNTREWIQSFKSAVAAATSLADLKNRVAALPDMPDRTIAQAKNAVQNKINSGDSD